MEQIQKFLRLKLQLLELLAKKMVMQLLHQQNQVEEHIHEEQL